MSGSTETEAFVRRLVDGLDREAVRAECAGGSGREAPDAPAAEPDDRAAATAAAVLARLRDPATWTDPPSELRLRILAATRAEAAGRTLRVVPAPAPVDAVAEPALARSDAGPTDAALTAPPLTQPSLTQPSLTQPSLTQPSLTGPPLTGPPLTGPPLAAPRRPSAEPVARRVPRWRRLSAVVPMAAVAATVFTVAVLAVDDVLERPERGTTSAVFGTSLAPRVVAEVSVVAAAGGFAVVLDAHELPAAADGSYYAAFLTGPAGVVPLGSFHARQVGEPIRLWSGVDPAAYPTFTVTLQGEGDPPTPSGLVVLTGSLSD